LTSRCLSAVPTRNPYEAIARARKAASLYAAVVEAIDATPKFPISVRNIHLILTAEPAANVRSAFERKAEVRPASKATWRIVEELLIEHYFAT
jgi:hypothetical protein